MVEKGVRAGRGLCEDDVQHNMVHLNSSASDIINQSFLFDFATIRDNLKNAHKMRMNSICSILDCLAD